MPTRLSAAARRVGQVGRSRWLPQPDKVKGFNLASYAFDYSAFRFVIEFFRDDYRGSFIPGLSPSQFQSIILLAVGVFVVALRLKYPERFVLATDPASENSDDPSNSPDNSHEKSDEND